jgi:hypothetical protein
MTPALLTELVRSVERDGYAVAREVLEPAAVAAVLDGLERLAEGLMESPADRERSRSAGGVRNVLQLVPEAREAAESPAVRRLVGAVLGAGAFPVRAILFDKTAGANWKVGWHQDLIIPVRRRVETPGFGGWSVKAGVTHVHPPEEVLRRLLAVRLHLDDCGEENGPLRVLPGSPASGKLAPAAVREWRERAPAVTCCLPRGGGLLMRPLLLHASSPAVLPGRRRVLHLEFAAGPLPGGLEWPE